VYVKVLVGKICAQLLPRNCQTSELRNETIKHSKAKHKHGNKTGNARKNVTQRRGLAPILALEKQ
jgi:hypothetical protein